MLFSWVANWIDKHSLHCFYRSHFGVYCLGCGMQRSFAELLRGNIQNSFELFPALLPMLLMLVYLSLHLYFKFKDGPENLKLLFILNVVIIVFSYIYKLIN